jgi:uncharacterized protein with von Willebrand factor type A (vWA) domain
MSEMETALAAKIAGFVATLRENGFGAGIDESADALRIAESMGVMNKAAMAAGWRGLLCGRADEWHRFDDLFESYWRVANRQKLVESRTSGGKVLARDETAEAAGGKAGPALQPGEDEAGTTGESAAKEGASAAESLAQADFRTLTDPEQTRAIEAVIRHFARRLNRLQTRRMRAEHTGRRLDLRRTLRHGTGAGGALAKLHFLAPRRVRPRLVLLLDVSRSMSLYSFFLLRIARALALELSDVHVFLYHTRLTHVSGALTDSDPWRAQERLAMLSAGWAGGTRIGECLSAFSRLHGGLVHARTAVIIASDGFDTGEPGRLGQEMRALAGRAKTIVWLNPLKAVPGYAPAARGMSEALPYLDIFAPGHNLASVADALSALLAAL